jgi:hypothetical protein
MIYRSVAATAAVKSVSVTTAAAGNGAVKSASYAVGSACKALSETVYDAVAAASALTGASAVAAVSYRRAAATVSYRRAAATVSYRRSAATAVTFVKMAFVLTAAGAVILISDGTSAAADAVITV